MQRLGCTEAGVYRGWSVQRLGCTEAGVYRIRMERRSILITSHRCKINQSDTASALKTGLLLSNS